MAATDPQWTRYPEYLNRLEKILADKRAHCSRMSDCEDRSYTLILSRETESWINTLLVVRDHPDPDEDAESLRTVLGRFTERVLAPYPEVGATDEVVIEFAAAEFAMPNEEDVELEFVVAAYADHRIVCTRDEFPLDDDFFVEQALFKSRLME